MSDSPENQAPPSRPVLRPGQVIGGRYRIESLLGRGGMGVVYGALHELTQRRVALKVVDSEGGDQPGLHERFLGEARTAAAVRHPNVVDVLDMGTHGESPYLVMELLEGRSLDAWLEAKQPLPYEQVLAWLFPVIGALASLHEAGIVHRDIKPSNIFLSRGPRQTIVPKLLDFGLARAISDARLTRSGVVLGTPLYMAPEHAAGAQVGPPADIWSTGVVLFECVTGALPFTSTDRSVLAAQVLAGHVRPVRQVRADVPSALASAIDRALQRELGMRHASMRAFAQALASAAVLSQIAIPDNPDVVGLPDFPAWKLGATSGNNKALALTTTTLALSGAPPAAVRREPRSMKGAKAALVVLMVVLALGVALYRWKRATPAAVPAARVAAPRAAPPPTEAAAPGGAPAEPTAAPPPSRAEEEQAVPARKDPAEPQRRKARAGRALEQPAPKPPAEVETEWK